MGGRRHTVRPPLGAVLEVLRRTAAVVDATAEDEDEGTPTMIDYEEFCRGFERGKQLECSPGMTVEDYARLYLAYEHSGESEGAGFWAARLERIRELEAKR